MPTTTRPVDRWDDEIDLRPYVLALWRHRLLIVAVTALGGLLAFGAGSMKRPLYEAVAGVRVDLPGPIGQIQDITRYQALLTDDGQPAAAIKQFGLDTRFGITGSSYLSDVLRVQNDTRTISITVRLPDGDVAARVANGLASGLVAAADRQQQEARAAALAAAKAAVEETAGRLDQADARLNSVERTTGRAQPTRVRIDYDLANERYTEAARGYERLLADSPSDRAVFRRTATAGPSDRPIPRGRGKMTILGLLAGFLSIAGGVVARVALTALLSDAPAAAARG